MSGPKGGRLSLGALVTRSLELERQRQLAAEIAKRRAVDKFNRVLNEAGLLLTGIEERISGVFSLMTDSILFSDIKEEAEKLRVKYREKLQALAGTKPPHGTADILKAAERLASELERVEKKFYDEVTDIDDRVTEARSIVLSDKKQKEFADRLASTKRNEKTATADFVFGGGSEKENKKLQEIVSNMAFSIKKVQEYMQYSGPDAACKREAAETVKRCRGFLEEGFGGTAREIELVNKQCQYLRLIEQKLKMDISEFDDAYAQYVVECTEQGLEARDKMSFESTKDLRKEIRKLEEAAVQKASLNYIKEQIADVMEDMGYTVINSEILKPQKGPGQDYYQFDDDSAIRVSISDEGTIMMEVLGTGDDLPPDDREIEELLAKQEAFCQIHPEILERLEERGILIKDRYNQKPHRDFVKKVPIKKKKTARKKEDSKRERKLDIL